MIRDRWQRKSISPARLKPTIVFDSYWRFAAERQAVLFRRLNNLRPPWSRDPVLRSYKFTNAYRAADRVSQYLISSVIYGGGADDDPRNVLFRILLFKFFNRIETWELLVREIGPPSLSGFKIAHYQAILSAAMMRGERIYSAAYIVPPVRIFETQGRKHVGHLLLLDRMMKGSFFEEVQQSHGLKHLFHILTNYPSLGPFLGYQLAIDINYSTVVNHCENEFVVAGPGAIDGIYKCFANAGDFEPDRIVEWVCGVQEQEFERRGIPFYDLFGRRLQLIDCQNLFCEISKYARVTHPEALGVSGRTRIKQSFTANPALPKMTFPPKWGLDTSKLPRIDQAEDSAIATAPTQLSV